MQAHLAVSAHQALAIVTVYLYASLHYLVTPIVLIWLWRRHRDAYSPARQTLVIATLLALVGYTLLPIAPPRMLPGFVDTMARYAHAGWWGGDASAPRGTGQLTNQLAAMPSMHVGWALWCGWQLVQHAKPMAVRLLGAGYPLVMTFVVVATGNHYLLDAVAGIVVIVLAGSMRRAGRSLLVRRPQVIDLVAVESTAGRTVAVADQREYPHVVGRDTRDADIEQLLRARRPVHCPGDDGRRESA